MSPHEKNNRIFLENLLDSFAENLYSDDKEQLRFLVKEEGLDPDSMKNDTLKMIKRIQFDLNTKVTKREMELMSAATERAIEWVNSLLKNVSFSFGEFIKEEKLVLHNRNIESFSKKDIENTLVHYFTLKFAEEDKNK